MLTLRRSATAFVLIIGLTVFLSGSAGAGPFTDVPREHPAASSFELLKDLNIFVGYPDGRAGGDESLTREQFAAFLTRSVNGPDAVHAAAASLTFSDDAQVSPWAVGYMTFAVDAGLIEGYPDGSLGPKDEVTIAQAFTMVLRALNLHHIAERTGQWPANYLMLARRLGFYQGLDVQAETPVTRGDMALILDHMLHTPYAWDEQAEDLQYPAEPLVDAVHGGAGRTIVPVNLESGPLHVEQGEASWYGPGFYGNPTASGEIFDAWALTAAHRTLPFGTQVRVTLQANGAEVVVRINDCGPWPTDSAGNLRENRIIDLSEGAAQAIGMSGIGQVTLEVLKWPESGPTAPVPDKCPKPASIFGSS